MKRVFEFALQSFPKEEAEIFVLGIPMEGDVNSRKGAASGPDGVRVASDMIESYSPFFDRMLDDYKIWDDGDIAVSSNGVQKERLESIAKTLGQRIPNNIFPVFLGGDHAVTLPVISVMLKRIPDLEIVHLDAHADCQDSFENERYCYATVMRRISELMSPNRIHQLGIRTGIREEYEFCRRNTDFYPLTNGSFLKQAETAASKTYGKPVYVSFDIDVLEPYIAPGTSNPVCGGISMHEARKFIDLFRKHNIIGLDIVEVSPLWDPSQITALAAAEMLRDCILAWRFPK